MATSGNSKLQVQLSTDLKHTIEIAAAERGQSIAEFAASALGDAARQVIHDARVSKLSFEDSKLFVKLLDDPSIKPNKAMRTAAARYKSRMGG